MALEAAEMGGEEEEDDEEEEEDEEEEDDELVDRDERWRAGGREMEGGSPWWCPPVLSANRADDIKWPLVARSIDGGVSGKGYPPGGW